MPNLAAATASPRSGSKSGSRSEFSHFGNPQPSRLRLGGWRRFTRRLVAATGLLLAAAAPGDESAPLLDRLVATEPDRLVAFEQIVGPLERDRSDSSEAWYGLERSREEGPIARLSVAFLVDHFHEDPETQRDLRLRHWTVEFRQGWSEAKANLERALGPPEVLTHQLRPTLRYGKFFLKQGAETAFELSWFRQEPEWAVPERTGAEAEAAENELIALLAGRIDRERLAGTFGDFEPEGNGRCASSESPRWRVRICPTEALRPNSIRVDVRGEPLPANRLIASLGLADPGIVSRDVHLASRDLVDLQSMEEVLIDGYELGAWYDESEFEPLPFDQGPRGGMAWRPSHWLIRVLFLQLP